MEKINSKNCSLNHLILDNSQCVVWCCDKMFIMDNWIYYNYPEIIPDYLKKKAYALLRKGIIKNI